MRGGPPGAAARRVGAPCKRHLDSNLRSPVALVSSFAMRACCLEEAGRTLQRHRDVAICDGCGRLVLAYGNQSDFDKTVEELTDAGVAHETGELGERSLLLVAKDRAGGGPRRPPRGRSGS